MGWAGGRGCFAWGFAHHHLGLCAHPHCGAQSLAWPQTAPESRQPFLSIHPSYLHTHIARPPPPSAPPPSAPPPSSLHAQVRTGMAALEPSRLAAELGAASGLPPELAAALARGSSFSGTSRACGGGGGGGAAQATESAGARGQAAGASGSDSVTGGSPGSLSASASATNLERLAGPMVGVTHSAPAAAAMGAGAGTAAVAAGAGALGSGVAARALPAAEGGAVPAAAAGSKPGAVGTAAGGALGVVTAASGVAQPPPHPQQQQQRHTSRQANGAGSARAANGGAVPGLTGGGGGGGGAPSTLDPAPQPDFLEMVPWYSGTSAGGWGGWSVIVGGVGGGFGVIVTAAAVPVTRCRVCGTAGGSFKLANHGCTPLPVPQTSSRPAST